MGNIAEITAEEVTRISGNRNTIRAKLVELNLAVSTATLDALATAISEIVNRGTVNASVKEGETVTLEPGYYSGAVWPVYPAAAIMPFRKRRLPPRKRPPLLHLMRAIMAFPRWW